MRLRQPCGFDQPHRTADLMRFALIFACQYRGRHQCRRQLDCLHHGVARAVAIDGLELERARRQQHAALTPPGRFVDQSGFKIVIEDRQRPGPVAPGAAKSQHRLRRPGRGRGKLQGLLREHHRGNRIIGALRLDEQPAQTEQSRILTFGHGAKGRLRAGAVAVELRRLRMQQQRQRIVAGMAARDIGMRRAAEESPWPTASSPWVMACRPRARRRSRRLRRIRAGRRQNASNIVKTSIAATMTMPSNSTNAGSEGWRANCPTTSRRRRADRPPMPRPRQRAQSIAETE